MGLDTTITKDNFDHVDFWASEGLRSGGVHSPNWGAVTKFQTLNRDCLNYLMSIQPDDQKQWGFTLDQKMNWLIGDATNNPPSRPYWTIGGKWNQNWIQFRFGTMVFGHSKIRVKTNDDGSLKIKRFLTQYLDGDRWVTEEVEFLEVDGFRPEMMDLSKYPVEWLLENAYLQQATEAFGNNRINKSPRGVIYHPVWSPDYWSSNYGPLYLARFCIVE
jgi:hypothetical protein